MTPNPEEIPGFDKDAIMKAYAKSNYRVIGKTKHSAIKPCHWQEQKLLTGRSNRNCYKGYFGIESELCVQNTPALPFCNHQCVFCWRDIESSSYGAEWKGKADLPKRLVPEMIRHSQNIIFEHITIERSLENLQMMYRLLEFFKENYQNSEELKKFSENELADELNSTRAKIHRSALLLHNCGILVNPSDDLFHLSPKIGNELGNGLTVQDVITRDVTTEEEIKAVFENAKNPRHAAISLAGEPTLYPYIGELVQEFRKRNFCTFIVTNGTNPETIKKLKDTNSLPTQLYVTVPASNEQDFNRITRPLTKDGWVKLNEVLSMLPKLSCRTVIRITAVKYLNINDNQVKEYAEIFRKNPPHFIDIKGFTVEAHALDMKIRLGKLAGDHELRDFAPSFNDLLHFAELLAIEGGFEIIEMHEPSRDILLRASWPKEKDIKIDFNQL